MINRDVARNFIGIGCDDCGREAPPVEEIKQAFGLNRLGWYCSGGRHVCPACVALAEQPKSRVVSA